MLLHPRVRRVGIFCPWLTWGPQPEPAGGHTAQLGGRLPPLVRKKMPIPPSLPHSWGLKGVTLTQCWRRTEVASKPAYDTWGNSPGSQRCSVHGSYIYPAVFTWNATGAQSLCGQFLSCRTAGSVCPLACNPSCHPAVSSTAVPDSSSRSPSLTAHPFRLQERSLDAGSEQPSCGHHPRAPQSQPVCGFPDKPAILKGALKQHPFNQHSQLTKDKAGADGARTSRTFGSKPKASLAPAPCRRESSALLSTARPRTARPLHAALSHGAGRGSAAPLARSQSSAPGGLGRLEA